MGTIADKSSYLNETKNQLKQAINNKGGSLTANSPFRSYVDEINNLPTSGTSDATATASDIANGKTAYVNGQKLTGTNTNNATFVDVKSDSDAYLTSLLVSIPLIDTSNCTSFEFMFADSTNLTTIPQLNTTNATSMRDMFLNCPNLSNDSLNNILAMCINAASIGHQKTLTNIGLTSEQIAVCHSLSNYQAFLNAGWSDNSIIY